MDQSESDNINNIFDVFVGKMSDMVIDRILLNWGYYVLYS